MADVNYFVLYANGEVSAIHIGEADEDQIFETLMSIFRTKAGPMYDNYLCTTMSIFSAEDVAMVANSVDATDVVRNFHKDLNGFGFELFACWHEHSKALYQLGVYDKNRFLSGKDFDYIYGPVVLRAQLLQEEAAVEVPVSDALYVAEKNRESEARYGRFLFQQAILVRGST